MPNTNSLRYQLSRPLRVHRDISVLPVWAAIDRWQKFSGVYPSAPHPESEAVKFYMLNHAVGEVLQRVKGSDVLGKYEPILDMYNTQLSPSAARLFYYILLICARESRHAAPKLTGYWGKMEAKFGSEFKNFEENIRNTDQSTVLSRLKNNPPDVPLGVFAEGLSWVFYNGGFHGGYGGPKWGAIADVMSAFVQGKFSAEMMMDTGWTLCHNGGPIFNKGMLYTGYSGELNQILDIQASGQIPQYVASLKQITRGVPAATKKLWKDIRDILGSVFDGKVDSTKVSEVGVKKMKANLKKAKPPENTDVFTIGPFMHFEKIKRKKAK